MGRPRVALITGGAGGIGLVCARRLAAEGVRCALVDRDRDRVLAAATELGREHIGIAADVTKADEVKAAVAAASALGTVNVLINSAGITGTTIPSWEVSVDEVRRVMDVNFMGVFLTCVAVVPGMTKAGWGRIVNVASIAGKEGNPNLAAYSASKGAVIAFTKSLGKELAKTGILVNAIAPAVIATEMNKAVTPETLSYMLAKIPMGRLGQPEEAAELVAFLSSERMSFSTAAVFNLSGGRATY